jgi:zinc D-Ala-D-Ala carboxypeptidase
VVTDEPSNELESDIEQDSSSEIEENTEENIGESNGEQPRRSRGLLLAAQTSVILALIVFVYIILAEVAPGLSPAAPLAPLPIDTPFGLIPTATLDPTLDATIRANVSPFVCTQAAPEIATCTDCTYYPVDKVRGLPPTYAPVVVPTGLNGGGYVLEVVRQPLADLFAAATAAGHTPKVISAYRSYDEQSKVFSTWVSQELAAQVEPDVAARNAQRYSARPGHSEHQLGSAVDVACDSCLAFDDKNTRNLAFWKWLEVNAHLFGFALSYPRGMESLTGYIYEPWHIRYVGVPYATELYNAGYLYPNGTCLAAYLAAKRLY